MQSWRQTCSGVSPASLTVPWEQLGRIGVSVAAHKGLMDARALEWRSYEHSTGSLILTQSAVCDVHAQTHISQHSEWTLVKVDELNVH